MKSPRNRASSRAVVVGGGLIGLCCANALSRRGWAVTIVAERQPGEASLAAGGILGPSVESAVGWTHAFGVKARDRYPELIDDLKDRTGIHVSLLRNGILEVALTAEEAARLEREAPIGSQWLTPESLRDMEPALGHASGALYHPGDGAVDNVLLLSALNRALAVDPSVEFADVKAMELLTRAGTASIGIRTRHGLHEGDVVVLAAGSWTPLLAGLPRKIPVTPVRGQMLALGAHPLTHVAYGPRGYIVPRGENSVAGSTMELSGFDVATTEEGTSAIAAAALSLCPPLRVAPEVARWCGLRPMTPDLLPIIGRDPAHASLLYACGHSRNGILLAPITGEIIASLADGEAAQPDVLPFSIERFRGKC
ncbi:MAG: FAD-dependent oxidoreductase [Gemmatimonadaceae bacterium]|nr:FAD-dependent oxidoreductase [Gemmatimonadaceae bacterium]MDQ3519839.1 FAD-dependent oxidoreductase [Gemmatimonadota bacterium]